MKTELMNEIKLLKGSIKTETEAVKASIEAKLTSDGDIVKNLIAGSEK